MILTYVCFEPASLSPAVVADLIESEDLGFVPVRIGTDQFGRSGGVKYSAKSLVRLRALKDVAWVSVEGDGGRFEVGGIAGWPAQVLVLESQGWPPESLIEAATVLPGFVAAMVGDGDDVFWQSADQVNTYEVHGRPWEHLPKVRDEVFDRDKIDISGNPGRRVPAPGLWLWAASKIWFGPGAFALIERERLLKLPVGKVLIRADGVVVVELFDLSDDLTDVRDAQRVFRDWLDYDGLEARGAELASVLSDPRVEFEVGEFPNGGVRRVTEWSDAGRLVPRSVASERRCFELDAAGEVLWQEMVDIG